MNPSLILDRPNVAAPERSRRFEFGASGGERVAILNGRAKAFEGGGDEPELSLKWVPAGAADYRIGRTQMHVNRRAQLLLNRGNRIDFVCRRRARRSSSFGPADWRMRRGRRSRPVAM